MMIVRPIAISENIERARRRLAGEAVDGTWWRIASPDFIFDVEADDPYLAKAFTITHLEQLELAYNYGLMPPAQIRMWSDGPRTVVFGYQLPYGKAN